VCQRGRFGEKGKEREFFYASPLDRPVGEREFFVLPHEDGFCNVSRGLGRFIFRAGKFVVEFDGQLRDYFEPGTDGETIIFF